jgi:demethylmenaquinone methyltransferase / 2-methoxy-6-polyprenyl-1,4-benzoquinol methylase
MELDFIENMFDGIARRYDLLNRLLSLRQDVYWRRKMISALELRDPSVILDVACGTGDVMMELIRRHPELKLIIGADFSMQMLKIAHNKIKASGCPANAALMAANGLKLPIASASLDAVTIAFGIRNIMDRQGALAGFYDCLKPGGRLAVLELSTPENRLFKKIYLHYFKAILPRIGALLSRDTGAYHYLPSSVLEFPRPPAFAALMRRAGFIDIRWQQMTLGICTLHLGVKPLIP